MVFDPRGEGKLICSAIVPTERTDMVSIIFEELQRLAPEACQKVSVFMSDLTHVFETAWKNTFGEDGGPTFAKCAMHVEEAWKRNIKNDEMLGNFKDLRTDGSEERVMQNYRLLEDLKDNEDEQIARWPDESDRRTGVAALNYFFDNYGLDGRVTQLRQFCRFHLNGSCAHQIHLERQHLKLKQGGKPCDRIDQAVANFEAVEKEEVLKEISVTKEMRNVKKSSAQVQHLQCHPDEDQVANYQTQDLGNDEYLIRNQEREYIVSVNPFDQCDKDKCLVLCKHCGAGSPCAHVLRCTCKNFGRHNYCKHTHIIIGQYFKSQNSGSVVSQSKKGKQKKIVTANLERISSIEKPEPRLYSDQRKEKKDKEKRQKIEQLQQWKSANQSRQANQPDDPNNNPSTSNRGDDHQDLAKDLKQLWLDARRECSEALSELRRAADRAGQTDDGLRYLDKLTKQVKALTAEGKPVAKLNWQRAHVPGRNVRRPNQKERKRRFVKSPPSGCHISFTLPMMFAGGADHDFWPELLSSSMKEIEKYINEQPPEDQMDLQLRLQEARNFWNCEPCGEQRLINIRSGFIRCHFCNRMFHQRCVNMEVHTILFHRKLCPFIIF